MIWMLIIIVIIVVVIIIIIIIITITRIEEISGDVCRRETDSVWV